ncbi:MAG: glycosyltransferase family 4 protein [Candidatus Doudnabacteria bacterium]|nr:glycosyltransferase family 4 protein [Candidatus Doudnabacteria bacterium]
MIIGIDASRAGKLQKTGTEWYSYFLIEELKKLPTSHGFVLYSSEPLTGELGQLPGNFENLVLAWPPSLLWTQARLSAAAFARPPDRLFVPSHALPFFSRAKTVVTVHDVGFMRYPDMYSFLDLSYHRLSVSFASRFAHRIICPSEFTKRELITFFSTPPEKIRVVPHGAPQYDQPTAPNTSDVAVQPTVFFVGRLEKKKNILGLLMALVLLRRTHPDLKLVLAGKPGFGFAEIKTFIENNGLRKTVEIKRYISEAEKILLYQRAVIFGFPSFYEGFGLPILEAQFFGCPVLTSDFGATKEIAGLGAYLVDPKSPESIAEGLTTLLRDRSLRKKLILSGRENLKRFSWTRTAQATLKVLEE